MSKKSKRLQNPSGDQSKQELTPDDIPFLGVTYVAIDKMLEIIHQSGLETEEKKAWIKVVGPGGARVYVPKQKNVGRVDIAGWSAPEGTSVKLGDRAFGAVQERLDMSLPEEQVLENFRLVLKCLAALPIEKPDGGSGEAV